MKHLVILLALAGCAAAPEDQPYFKGPASLYFVPPNYYSKRPPIRKAPPVVSGQAAQKSEPQQRYYYPKPGKPEPLPNGDNQDKTQQIYEYEKRLDEASQEIYKLRQQLNRRRPARARYAPEDTEGVNPNDQQTIGDRN